MTRPFEPPTEPIAVVRPRSGRAVGPVVVVVLACLVAATVSGLLIGDDRRHSTATDLPGSRVSGDGWTVGLPEPAPGGELVVAAGGSHAPDRTEAGAATGGLLGEPVEITLDGAPLPTAGAVVTRTLDRVLGPDEQATLAYFDPATAVWTPVPTDLSPDRRTLTATTHHFSWWTEWVTRGAEQLGLRTEPPRCSGEVPDWVRDTAYLDDANSPVRWCVGRDPKHPDLLEVHLKVNRGYGVAVRTGAPPEWTWNSVFSGAAGPKDVATAAFAGALDRAGPFERRLFVPGGQEAVFGIRADQVGGGPLVVVEADTTSLMANALYETMTRLGEDGPTAGIVAMVGVAECGYELHDAGSDGVADVTGALMSCLVARHADVTRLLAGTLADRTDLPEERIGQVVGRFGRVLKYVEIGRLAFTTSYSLTEWTADRQLSDSAWRLQVWEQPRRRGTTAVVPAEFVGNWSVHGSTLRIDSDGSGTEEWDAGPCSTDIDVDLGMCSGRSTLSFAAGPDGLVGTVRTVEYVDGSGSAVDASTLGAEGPHPGSAFLLSVEDDRVLRSRALAGPDPGNPLWCGEGASPSWREQCN